MMRQCAYVRKLDRMGQNMFGNEDHGAWDLGKASENSDENTHRFMEKLYMCSQDTMGKLLEKRYAVFSKQTKPRFRRQIPMRSLW
jgi:hypothetical protein